MTEQTRRMVHLERPGAAGAGRLARATPRLRVVFEDGLRLGPGKIDLLEAILTTGSISAGGRQLGMSYRRAWLLVDQVNRLFAEPVVVAVAGGAHGGGARVTETGRALIAAYRRIEDRTRQAIADELGPLAHAMADDPDAQAP